MNGIKKKFPKIILITGASGYIGGNLIQYIKQSNDYDVIPVSRRHGFDLTKDNWTKNLPNKRVDTIIHLAQSNNYRDFPAGGEDMLKVNVNSTYYLLEWARSNNVKKFMFSSTGNVYKPDENPFKEDYCRQPESFYGSSKLIAENLITQYNNFFETIVMRLFAVYGGNQKEMLIPNMIKKIKNNEEITLAQGKGLVFNPIYIQDCIKIIYDLMVKDFDDSNLTINIAGEDKIDLSYIISNLEKLLSLSANCKITNQKVLDFSADISLLKNIFPSMRFRDINYGLKTVV